MTATITTDCTGQCGGEITLHIEPSGYVRAQCQPGATNFVAQDADNVERLDDDAIEVRCAAVDAAADVPCAGVVVFDAARLSEAPC